MKPIEYLNFKENIFILLCKYATNSCEKITPMIKTRKEQTRKGFMKRWYLACACAVVVGVMIVDSCFGADLLTDKDIQSHTNNMIDTIFGWPRKIAAAGGAGYGVIQSFATGSPKPLMTWGGLALITMLIPTIYNTLFV